MTTVAAANQQPSFVVKAIKVEGLTRIDEGTVFNDLPIKMGDTFQQEDSPKVIRQLFASGFFSDVQVAKEDQTLLVTVIERPSIGRIDLTGNKDIKSEDLQKALESVGIAEGRTFEQSVLNKVEQELEQQYYSRGKYGVQITTEVKTLERNRVAISIAIVEGDAARIKKISLVGNKAFTEEELTKKFNLSHDGWLTWFTKSDQYSKEKLRADLEGLRSFYLDRGYINFNISSTQVSITPDKRDIYITINIDEGEAYTIADITVAGTLPVPAEELQQLIDIEKGELFSRRKLTRISSKMVERLGDEGYAFAKINPIRDLNEEKHEVKLSFFVDPGSRVYVRRINFLGNHTTDTEVLRREMRQMEGAWISTSKVTRSRTNLMLLGFFEDAQIETKPVAGVADQVDLDIKVAERNSGQLSGGIGYSQVDGLLFNLGVRQTNFMGSGKLVDFNFNRSSAFTTYRVGYNNPYYTPDGISRGFETYYQESDLREINISRYTRDRLGATVTFGVPVTEYDRVSLGLNLENTQIKVSSDETTVSSQLTDFIEDEGDSFDIAKLTFSWSHMQLDQAIFPSSGLSQNLKVQAVIPGSTLQFFEVSSNVSYYLPLYKKEYIALFKTNIAYGDGYGSTEALPIFENFYAGGIGSVRGFRGNTLGPKDSLEESIGGNLLTTATTEFIFPMPFVETNALRTSIFFDAGNVFTTDSIGKSSGPLRYSAGLTAQWMSPIGPFVFSFARPLNERDGDKTETFQFTVGTTF